jgi:hypothetical protein
MKQQPPNARFWELINGSPVKITLRPGQELQYSSFHWHDEGWTRETYWWRHDGDTIQNTYCNDGTDCDGRLTRGCSSFARLDQLAVREPYGIDDPAVRWPNWQKLDSYQRDAYAEAMGY